MKAKPSYPRTVFSSFVSNMSGIVSYEAAPRFVYVKVCGLDETVRLSRSKLPGSGPVYGAFELADAVTKARPGPARFADLSLDIPSTCLHSLDHEATNSLTQTERRRQGALR